MKGGGGEVGRVGKRGMGWGGGGGWRRKIIMMEVLRERVSEGVWICVDLHLEGEGVGTYRGRRE